MLLSVFEKIIIYFGRQKRAEGPIDIADARIDSSFEFQFKTKYLNLIFSQLVLAKTFGTIEYEYRIGTLVFNMIKVSSKPRSV